MFDLKKTIIISLTVAAMVALYIAGETVGTKVGYSMAMGKEHALIIKQDSLLRKQTELNQKLIDFIYADKFKE